MSGRSTGLLTSFSGDRRVPLRGRITQQNAAACIARLVLLAVEAPRHPIVIYLDSPGGLVRESLSIISTMNGIKCPVATFCCGSVGGTAAVIAAHGSHGFRSASANSAFSFKTIEGSGRSLGSSSHHQFHHLLAEIMAKDARKPQAGILQWLSEGAEFNAQQALSYGLIDAISSRPLIPKV